MLNRSVREPEHHTVPPFGSQRRLYTLFPIKSVVKSKRGSGLALDVAHWTVRVLPLAPEPLGDRRFQITASGHSS
jgi:hypothetical protein